MRKAVMRRRRTPPPPKRSDSTTEGKSSSQSDRRLKVSFRYGEEDFDLVTSDVEHPRPFSQTRFETPSGSRDRDVGRSHRQHHAPDQAQYHVHHAKLSTVMDPLSIIASVLGTVDVTLRSAKTLYELIDTVINGPVELVAIRRDTIAFYSILGSLERVLQDQKTDAEVKSQSKGKETQDGPWASKSGSDEAIIEVLSNLAPPLNNCMDTLFSLESLVQKNVKPTGEMKKSRWRNLMFSVFGEKELRMLNSRLVEGKLTLEMALMAINTIRGARIEKVVVDGQEGIGVKIEALRRDLREMRIDGEDEEKVNLASLRGRVGSEDLDGVETRTELGFALERFLESTTVMDRPPSPGTALWEDNEEDKQGEVGTHIENGEIGLDDLSGKTLTVAETKRLSREPSPRRPERIDWHAADTSVYDGRWSVPDIFDPNVPSPQIEILMEEDTSSETTALNLAARHGNVELVLRLLEGGASPKEEDDRGYTPLHEACSHGRDEVVKMLLDNKVNTEAVDNQGMTPMHKATLYSGRSNMTLTTITLLVEHNAIIDARDDFGKTPLHYAAWQGRDDVVLFLLQHNANTHVPDNLRWTPLLLAIQRNNTETAEILLQTNSSTDKLAYRGPHSMTALMWAVEMANKKLVEILLSKDADTDLRDRHGNTALHFAASWGLVDIMQLLIEANADIELENNSKARPIHVAAQYGQAEAITILLNWGARVEEPAARGWPPLHQAAGRGHANVIKALLEHPSQQADIESRGEYYKTAMIWAAEIAQVNSLRELISHGADITVQDAFGESVLHYSSANGVLKVVRLLVQSGANIRKKNGRNMAPLHCASAEHDGVYPIIRYLLDNGAEKGINDRDKDGMTALHYAARNGNERVVGILLEKGANAAIKNKEGKVPWEIAEKAAHGEVMRILKEKVAVKE